MTGIKKKSQLKKAKINVRNIFLGEWNKKIKHNIGRKVNFVAKPKPQTIPIKSEDDKASFLNNSFELKILGTINANKIRLENKINASGAG